MKLITDDGTECGFELLKIEKLKPGDVVLVKIKKKSFLTQKHYDGIASIMNTHFPDNKVLVATDDIDMSVILDKINNSGD